MCEQTMPSLQTDFFRAEKKLLSGFQYQPDFFTVADENLLIGEFEKLPFKEFEFHGFQGRRRVVSFGWRYDFNEGGLKKADDMPAFLLPLREQAANFAFLAPSELDQALITEYRPGAAIGWHRDRSVFAEVIGLSFLSACTFRFRRKSGLKWDRVTLVAEPRSIYVLRDAARTEWEHSIPALNVLRYSVTFRRLDKL